MASVLRSTEIQPDEIRFVTFFLSQLKLIIGALRRRVYGGFAVFLSRALRPRVSMYCGLWGALGGLAAQRSGRFWVARGIIRLSVRALGGKS